MAIAPKIGIIKIGGTSALVGPFNNVVLTISWECIYRRKYLRHSPQQPFVLLEILCTWQILPNGLVFQGNRQALDDWLTETKNNYQTNPGGYHNWITVGEQYQTFE